MNLMLGSVRNVAEAELAYACKVDWIDVKDPADGALGAARPEVVRSIVRFVARRLPVSATIGDCWDDPDVIADRAQIVAETGADYVKAGLNARDVSIATLNAVRAAVATDARIIVVCMAERAPTANDIDALAACGISGLMLDTADKSGPRLPALLESNYLEAFVRQSRQHGLLTGLAGRLELDDVEQLALLGADYLGFRSALCDDARRSQGLSRRATLSVRAALSEMAARHARQSSEVV